NAALVQNVLAQVDARAAARAAGQPVPAFQPPQLSPLHPNIASPSPNPLSAPNAPTAGLQRPAPVAQQTHRSGPVAPPRRLGVEIFITLLAFLAVAVPALYFLYATFAD